MIRRGLQASAAAVVAVTALVFPLAGISGAPKGPAWTQVPFSEVVFDPSTQVNVTLSGSEKVSIVVTGDSVRGWTETLTAKLHKTTGIDVANRKYRAKGSYTSSVSLHPGPATSTTTFPATFLLHPPNPCRANHPPSPCFSPSTVQVPATVTLNADGSVASIQVGHST
jgi:hypothetical protein